MLPGHMRDTTGVMYASSFPALDAAIGEVRVLSTKLFVFGASRGSASGFHHAGGNGSRSGDVLLSCDISGDVAVAAADANFGGVVGGRGLGMCELCVNLCYIPSERWTKYLFLVGGYSLVLSRRSWVCGACSVEPPSFSPRPPAVNLPKNPVHAASFCLCECCCSRRACNRVHADDNHRHDHRDHHDHPALSGRVFRGYHDHHGHAHRHPQCLAPSRITISAIAHRLAPS